MTARRRGGSRTGTFLVLMGIVGVLTVTFGRAGPPPSGRDPPTRCPR